MEAATVHPQAAAPAGKTHKFISRGRNERLVRSPRREQIVNDRLQILDEGITIEFAPEGTFDATEGKDLMVDGRKWLADDATLAARGLPARGEPRDEVEALRSHYLYGIRFHEEGREIDRPQPYEEDFLNAITDAVAELDLERATELLTAEREGHKRPVLVKAAEHAVENIERVNAAAAEQQKP